jgi:hypothetical protein
MKTFRKIYNKTKKQTKRKQTKRNKTARYVKGGKGLLPNNTELTSNIELIPIPEIPFSNNVRRYLTPNSTKWKNTFLSENDCNEHSPTFQNGKISTIEYVESKYPLNDNKSITYNTNAKPINYEIIPSLILKLNEIKNDDPCKIVVLGTFELIAQFFYFNKHERDVFTLLSAENWTEELNQKYLSCALHLALNNKTCKYPICVILPKNFEKLYRANGTPRATLLELTLLVFNSDFNIHKLNISREYEFDLYVLSKK